jgi:hypothetical protein
MNPAPPLPFPGSRSVAAWWRELAPQEPLRVWLTHLLVHRVEALADVDVTRPLGGLRLEVLRSLSAGHPPAGLDAGLLACVSRELVALGLLTSTDRGRQITPAGRDASATGAVASRALQRRCFCFVDNRALQLPPCYIRVLRRGSPVAPPEPWEFDSDILRQTALRPDDWKERRRFPREVHAVHLPEVGKDDWRLILFDQAEHFFVAFLELAGPAGETRLRGYAGQSEGWTLDTREAAIEIGESWQEALPDLAADPAIELWQGAWRAWGQQRGIPPAETATCRLARSGCLLQVEAPRRLLSRLQDTRSDALKGETWLLAGTGRARAAAKVELTEQVA